MSETSKKKKKISNQVKTNAHPFKRIRRISLGRRENSSVFPLVPTPFSSSPNVGPRPLAAVRPLLSQSGGSRRVGPSTQVRGWRGLGRGRHPNPPLESGQPVPAEVRPAPLAESGPCASLPHAARCPRGGPQRSPGAVRGTHPRSREGHRAPRRWEPPRLPRQRAGPGRGRGRRPQGGGSGTAAADRMGRVRPRFPAPGAGGRHCPGPRPGPPQGEAGMLGTQAPRRGSQARGAGSRRPHARRPRPGPLGPRLPRPRRSPYRPGCQAECVCALRGLRPSSDPRKGERRLGPAVAAGPPGWGSRSCRWTNRQSTFASSRAGRESEREKEARWRLASPYVLRHAAAYVRQAPQDRPPARRRPGHVTPPWRSAPGGRRRRHLLDRGSSCNPSFRETYFPPFQLPPSLSNSPPLAI
ncbi:translation initiation factor IF-2-like isoform X2 [Pteropus medius]|uniref:translation initiation factor IF-2-like isoform X2 n=1 Tax=Pteropus vampyrus TaxID=132908 RepID=UPI00196AA498|nr:translation initiation factor IF-2-like isoform X2 [Pteropus giganteus]